MPESTLEDRTHLKIASSLEYTLTQLRQIFRLPQNKDIVIRRMEVAGFAAALLYLDGMADQRIISLSIMEPCLQAPHYEGEISERMEWLRAHIVSASSAQSVEEMDEAVLSILRGDTLLLCEGSALGLLLETKGFARRAVEKPINDRVVMGAHEGFVESLRVNVTLIRRTIYSPRLVTETVSIGDRFPRSCALMYLDGIVNAQILAEVRRRIAGCRMDNIGGVGQLQQLIEDHPYALLPQMVHTERPDRAGSFLLAGQIVVLVDGSSTVLAMPISIFHLVHTPDDMFMRFQYSCFLRVIRYCGLLISLLLPAVYLSLIIHHKDVLPLSLITSIFENQARIPIPAFFELVLLSLVFDLINEASVRVPGAMGSTLSIVGGLILGQTVVSADLVSPLSIIVVAISGLGAFAVPDYDMTMTLRILQLLFLIVAALSGLYGILALGFVLLAQLCGMSSMGMPLMEPVAPERMHNPDVLMRYPLWQQRIRNYLSNPGQLTRVQGRARAWEGSKKK